MITAQTVRAMVRKMGIFVATYFFILHLSNASVPAPPRSAHDSMLRVSHSANATCLEWNRWSALSCSQLWSWIGLLRGSPLGRGLERRGKSQRQRINHLHPSDGDLQMVGIIDLILLWHFFSKVWGGLSCYVFGLFLLITFLFRGKQQNGGCWHDALLEISAPWEKTWTLKAVIHCC